QGLARDDHRLLEPGAIGAEAALPIPMRKHRHRMPARRTVVVLRENAAQGRGHAEETEVVAGHQLALRSLGLAPRGDAGLERNFADQAGEDAAALLREVAVHRVREAHAVVAVARGAPL